MVDLRLQSYVQFNYLISADEEWSEHVVTNKWLQNRVFFFFFGEYRTFYAAKHTRSKQEETFLVG